MEEMEPCVVGAHLVAGSLIKNPGGTLAPSGGYIAGRADLVAAAGRRLAAPGVEGGATLGMNRILFQGLFNAPQVVGEALKGACLVAHIMESLGYECNPPADAARTDIIQAVKLRERAKVLAFCEAVQRCSPVGAHIRPVAGITPGYGDEVQRIPDSHTMALCSRSTSVASMWHTSCPPSTLPKAAVPRKL